MKTIRVYQFGGPEVLCLEDAPAPTPGAGQVVIQARAIGVNPVETYQRSGSNPALTLPWTPGTDAAGTIEAVGPGVARWKPGARVYTSDTVSGAYSQMILAQDTQVHALPERVDFPQGAALNIPYATAYRALFQRGRALAGETVLIHGASGGVGVAALQLARAAGLTIIGTAGTDPGRKLVAEQGAHHVIDHRAPDYLQQVMALTSGRGVELILEMLANVNLGKDLTVLARGGRVIVIGSRGNVELTPRELMKREADVRGLMLFNASPEELMSIHAALAAGLNNGTLVPVVGREMLLSDAAKAHVAVLEPGAYGKIILRP